MAAQDGTRNSTRGGPQVRMTDAQRIKESSQYVGRGLFELYSKVVLPLEQQFFFDKFLTPYLHEADFMAKPMVLLMGQYSVGKTTFIKFLLGRSFPGMRIGPEPTTDKFVAIMHGLKERTIPGNAAAVEPTKPFANLESFGIQFLNRFEVAEVPSPLLDHITFIDSPGILAGEKQRVNRGYDFPKVVRYWANRCDRILLLFDAHKLDISDEFKNAILQLGGNGEKIRCVLNKADQIDVQSLMRVYGALLWSLGKVVQTPEVMRVYIGSYWDKPYEHTDMEKLFEVEKADLIGDLKSLPRHSAIRKVNEFVKRARRAKTHALICEHLRGQFGWFGHDAKQKDLLANIQKHFQEIASKYGLAPGDFPNPQKFCNIIKNFPISKFKRLRKRDEAALDSMLSNEVPGLLRGMEQFENGGTNESGNKALNPFNRVDHEELTAGGAGWVVGTAEKAKWDNKFYALQLHDGKADGGQLVNVMMQSGLSKEVLGAVWDLCDVDQDGMMDADEFAIAMHVVEEVKNGGTLPTELPESYVPPSKRIFIIN